MCGATIGLDLLPPPSVPPSRIDHCCDYSLFGTQLIPWCCGPLEYGKRGLIIGAKRTLRIATEDGTDPDGIKDLLRPRHARARA